MKLVMLPVAAALLAQFGTLPLLIGARSAGEAIGWPMIMAIFFGIPSFVVYFLMFGVFGAISPPRPLAIVLGIAIPATIVIGIYSARGTPLDLSPKNWVLWMAMIGGLAGTLTQLHLRSALTPVS
jgi:RsiW-degrading membrane proteinase PrsW (M82 family)